MGRTQQDRQEEWPIPNNVERREMIQRGVSHQGLLLLLPLPTEDRLFMDWSSIDSPRERMSQCDVSARNRELNIIQTDNQTDQPGSEPARIEATGNTLSDVMTFPSAC